MKKNIFHVLSIGLFLLACQPEKQKFTIQNSLSSQRIGDTILVQTESGSTLAAGNFENGRLLLKGNLEKAGFYKIVAQFDDKTKTKLAFPIWLNGDSISIIFRDDLTIYPKVNSSEKNQNDLNIFYDMLEKISTQANKDLRIAQQLFEENQKFARGETYNKLFYAIDIAKEEGSNSYLKAVEKFAEANPSSEVTLKIISATDSDLISKNPTIYFGLIKRMNGALTESKLYTDLYESLEKKTKVAIGQTLVFKFFGTDPSGKIVNEKVINDKKVVLLTFWKSSNRLGRTFKPYYQKVYEKYADKGFQIIGVSMDDHKEWWIKAVKDDKVTYPQVCDLKGIDSPYVPYYDIEYIPKNILMYSSGKIIEIDIPIGVLNFEIKKALGIE